MASLPRSEPCAIDEELAPAAAGEVDGVLLDFDGPICSLFSQEGADAALSAVRKVLEKGGPLPEDLRAETNAHVLLRRMAEHGAGHLAEANEALEQQELYAATSAVPTDGLPELVHVLDRLKIPMAIASNNSRAAIVDYLRLQQLEGYFAGRVHGRGDNPARMKPDRFCVVGPSMN
jgi:beta-phosphoglucomutase-like phosphatase (HAD superfamily)